MLHFKIFEESKRSKYKPLLSLDEKLKVIESVENGKKVAEICRERNLSHSTVSSIVQNSAKLKKQGLQASSNHECQNTSNCQRCRRFTR